jgi:hypothetical protein
LLKSIWRQPALWVNGHPDIEVLRRRGLISAFTQYLALTKAGFDALERVSVDDPV